MKQNAASMIDEAEHTNRLCQQLEAGSLRKPPATAHLRGHRVARPCPQNYLAAHGADGQPGAEAAREMSIETGRRAPRAGAVVKDLEEIHPLSVV
eukprot:scaffold11994_cov85-Phaeocystis_antarctica.AAC.3